MKASEVITATNKEFKIKVNGINFVGASLSKLVGFDGLVEILEDRTLALNLCKKALQSPADKHVRKLRRGLKITFYSK